MRTPHLGDGPHHYPDDDDEGQDDQRGISAVEGILWGRIMSTPEKKRKSGKEHDIAYCSVGSWIFHYRPRYPLLSHVSFSEAFLMRHLVEASPSPLVCRCNLGGAHKILVESQNRNGAVGCFGNIAVAVGFYCLLFAVMLNEVQHLMFFS